MDSGGLSVVDPIALLPGLCNRLRQPSGDVVSGFRSGGAASLDVVKVEAAGTFGTCALPGSFFCICLPVAWRFWWAGRNRSDASPARTPPCIYCRVWMIASEVSRYHHNTGGGLCWLNKGNVICWQNFAGILCSCKHGSAHSQVSFLNRQCCTSQRNIIPSSVRGAQSLGCWSKTCADTVRMCGRAQNGTKRFI